MIKAIIFDYFGVISSDEYWDFVGTDKDLTTEWVKLANDVNLGRLSWQDFLQGLAEATGKSLEEVRQVYEREMINPQLVALVKELHEHYKTGLLTNAHHDFIEPILKSSHLDQIFDAVAISSRVGTIKPNEAIYLDILTKLEVEPAQAVFVDDIERNVAGAKKLGMLGIHYKSLDGLKYELERVL